MWAKCWIWETNGVPFSWANTLVIGVHNCELFERRQTVKYRAHCLDRIEMHIYFEFAQFDRSHNEIENSITAKRYQGVRQLFERTRGGHTQNGGAEGEETWWWRLSRLVQKLLFFVLLLLFLCHHFCCCLSFAFASFAFCPCRMLSWLQYKVIQCSILFSIFISAVDTLNSLELFHFSCAVAAVAQNIEQRAQFTIVSSQFCYIICIEKNKTWTLSESLLFFSHSPAVMFLFLFSRRSIFFVVDESACLLPHVPHHISSFEHKFIYFELSLFLLFHTIPTFFPCSLILVPCILRCTRCTSFANCAHSAMLLNFTGFGFGYDCSSDH